MLVDYFTSSCAIKRPTTTNVGGIAQTSYTTIATVMGKIRQLNGREIYQNEKQNEVTTHRVYLPIIDVKYNDVLTIEDNNYKVKIVNNPMGMNEFLQVDCEKKPEIQ